MKSQNITASNIFILLLLSLNFFNNSCSNHSPKPNAIQKNSAIDGDTIISPNQPKSQLKYKKDEGVPSPSDILNDLQNSYTDTIKIDTSYLVKGYEIMTVTLKHYCTYDNKINLPNRYLKIYNLSRFQTHNFLSALKVKFNSKVVFNGFIQKADFKKFLDDELRKYGVLLYPNVRLTNNGIEIQYSISVPLSDVGKGLTIQIDTSGNKHIASD